MSLNFPPGTPNWVDLGSTDVKAAAAFYSELFGWAVEDMGAESGGYGLIRKDGRQVGGIGPATDPSRGTSWSIYFSTDDAEETAASVVTNGGRVILAPLDVMDQGRMSVFQDPTGAYFSVWEPGKHAGAEIVDAPGAMSWVELMTTDVAAAKAFYASVLGVSTRDVEMPNGMMYTLFGADGQNVAGAMAIGPEATPMPSHWSVYFAVDDCDAVADRALELGGGETLRDSSPAGRLAFLTDPQGGAFCIITPDPTFTM
jgi:predicted enzyme related to lactoylglutathione lyase